jgi:hypothetical protein
MDPTYIPSAVVAETDASSSKPAPAAAVQELDIAFCCDCTGSMGSYIKSAQDNIRAISQSIHDKAANVTVRYALVKYRDHPPQDSTFITEVFPFTKKIDVMKANIDTMVASGGGDGPEAVAAALHEIDQLDWRANAVKICVLIADAPPHGLGENGDGFPDGSPDGADPIQTCKSLASKGVTVYAVGVEPILSTSYQFARDFMMMVAKVTDGKFLPLGKADILAQVIVSGALEGVNMAETWAVLEKEIAVDAAKKGETLTAQEQVSRVQQAMMAKPAMCEQVEVENPYLDARYDESNVMAYYNATSLKSARAQTKASLNSHVAKESNSYAWGQQQAQCAPAAMSSMQCARAGAKAQKAMGIFSYGSE